MRALLQNPLITSGGRHASSFVLIRRHATFLNQWLSRNAGWSLYVDSETARLRKQVPDLADDTRGVMGKRPFNRRRYVLFCLALAALGQGDKQTTLGRLFEGILRLAASDSGLAEAGLGLDPNIRSHRRDLVDAVTLMMDLGLLHQVDGDEAAYLGGQGDVLYTINRSALSWVLNVRRSPGTIENTNLEERLSKVTRESQPETQEGANRRIRLYLTRKLLDDPVLYYDRLDEAHMAYLNSQRPRIVREIESATGLRSEIRREGIAMVDEEGDLTDLDMPKEGTEGHFTLLVAEFLAERLQKNGQAPVGRTGLERAMAKLAARYGKYWRKDARKPEAVKYLLTDALERLRALGLIELTEDGASPLPALARYSLEEPRIAEDRKAEQGTVPWS